MHSATPSHLFAYIFACTCLLVSSLSLAVPLTAMADTKTNARCTIITSFTKASEQVYLSQFEQLRLHLQREKIQVWHVMRWQSNLDARKARLLRKQWQLRYRRNNAVLLDRQMQLLHRYEQEFDLVDALMRCRQAQNF